MVGELVRRWLEERPILGRVFKLRTQLVGPVSGRLVDSGLEEMARAKREEWIRRGISPRLADKAVELAKGWAERIARWHVSHLKDILPPEELSRVEREILRRYLREGLNKVAEEWIEAMSA